MRTCAKLQCGEAAAATVAMRYRQRVLWVADLFVERDPNLIDLCEGHADRIGAPFGWERLDERTRPVEPVRLPVAVPQSLSA